MLISSTMSYLESIFYAVPLSLLPLLNTTARMDLIDFYKEQQSAVVVNSIGGETTLESLEEKCITLRYTPASIWKMELLADSTIRVTRTFYARDTTHLARVYNKKWQVLRKQP
jgi:hypothetical protein